jgi:hypothetical protein
MSSKKILSKRHLSISFQCIPRARRENHPSGFARYSHDFLPLLASHQQYFSWKVRLRHRTFHSASISAVCRRRNANNGKTQPRKHGQPVFSRFEDIDTGKKF